MKIKFEINEHPIEIDENPMKKLSEFLRQNNYFSIKNGCTRGKCGCCTVLVNNIPTLSCLIPLAKIEQTKIANGRTSQGPLHHIINDNNIVSNKDSLNK